MKGKCRFVDMMQGVVCCTKTGEPCNSPYDDDCDEYEESES